MLHYYVRYVFLYNLLFVIFYKVLISYKNFVLKVDIIYDIFEDGIYIILVFFTVKRWCNKRQSISYLLKWKLMSSRNWGVWKQKQYLGFIVQLYKDLFMIIFNLFTYNMLYHIEIKPKKLARKFVSLLNIKYMNVYHHIHIYIYISITYIHKYIFKNSLINKF